MLVTLTSSGQRFRPAALTRVSKRSVGMGRSRVGLNKLQQAFRVTATCIYSHCNTHAVSLRHEFRDIWAGPGLARERLAVRDRAGPRGRRGGGGPARRWRAGAEVAGNLADGGDGGGSCGASSRLTRRESAEAARARARRRRRGRRGGRGLTRRLAKKPSGQVGRLPVGGERR